MESPVAAAKPPLGWKEPAASPLHKPLLSLPPNTNGASSSSTSGSSNGNHNRNNNHGGAGGGLPGHPAVKTIPRSDANPYPTTFVQADTNSFKQVVQMLTGSSETAAKHAATASSPRPATTTAGVSAGSASDLASPRPHPPPPLHPHHPPPPPTPIPPTSLKPSSIPTGPKRPAFKLYERRHNSFKNLRINPLVPGLFNGVLVTQASSASSTPNSPSFSRTPTPATTTGFSPRYKPEILSPSILDFPSLALSPVTPLSPDPFNRPPATSASSTPQSSSAEDRAIAEKGFYLHPSPRSSLGAEPPRLLPLFPVTSPRVAAAAASSASSGATDSSA